MATAEDQPQALDEIVWRSPPVVQEMGGIHTNTVQHYFARSPFFDGTSNNATLSNQAMFNPHMVHLVQTRAAFEGHLRSMGGLEFMVVHDPSQNGTKIDNSGVWVIRKQNRRKRGGMDDEITPLGEYFVVGESVYMAPSVGSIVESRTLSAASALTSFLSSAVSLPSFTPSLGHTYLPPVSKPLPTTSTSDRASLSGSVRASKESTPLPIPDSQRGSSVGASERVSVSSPGSADRRGAALLRDSLKLAVNFGEEYMDETPLVGEPGSFVVQSQRVRAAGSALGSFVGGLQSQGASQQSQSVKTPLSLKTDVGAVEEGEGERTAGGKSGKEKSPVSPLSPLTPGGGKKRKKSRSAQGAGGKVSAS